MKVTRYNMISKPSKMLHLVFKGTVYVHFCCEMQCSLFCRKGLYVYCRLTLAAANSHRAHTLWEQIELWAIALTGPLDLHICFWSFPIINCFQLSNPNKRMRSIQFKTDRRFETDACLDMLSVCVGLHHRWLYWCGTWLSLSGKH